MTSQRWQRDARSAPQPLGTAVPVSGMGDEQLLLSQVLQQTFTRSWVSSQLRAYDSERPRPEL